jgi:hypothetical protein
MTFVPREVRNLLFLRYIYGVVVRYEQRADRVRGKDRKRTDLELSFDGKRAAVDFTVPNTLKLKQRTPGHVYVPYEVREEAENLKNNKYVSWSRETLRLLNGSSSEQRDTACCSLAESYLCPPRSG